MLLEFDQSCFSLRLMFCKFPFVSLSFSLPLSTLTIDIDSIWVVECCLLDTQLEVHCLVLYHVAFYSLMKGSISYSDGRIFGLMYQHHYHSPPCVDLLMFHREWHHQGGESF